jgi:hypothetical protein
VIQKGKAVQFYTWEVEGKKVQVIGERNPGSGGLVFSFYQNKVKIDDSKGELVQRFIKELNQ